MDLDAIMLFMQVFSQESYNACELLLMSSAIKNGTININYTIHDNLINLFKEKKYLGEKRIGLADLESDYINTPIYEKLLKNPKLWFLLKLSFENNKLESDSLLKTLEICISLIGKITNEEDVSIINFLIELISIKRIKEIDSFQKSKIIAKFVADNNYLIVSDNDNLHNNSKSCFYIRIFLLKLFAYGLVNFNYYAICDYDEDPINGYKNIIEPLIKSRSYGHLRLVFNSKIINKDNIDIVISIIENIFNEIYTVEQSEENIEKDQKIINSINELLNLIVSNHTIKTDFIKCNTLTLVKKVDL